MMEIAAFPFVFLTFHVVVIGSSFPRKIVLPGTRALHPQWIDTLVGTAPEPSEAAHTLPNFERVVPQHPTEKAETHMIAKYGLSLSIAACAESARKLDLKPTVTDAAAKVTNLERFEPFTRAPILLRRTNGLFLESVRWGWADSRTQETVLFSPAEGRNYGRRCLILASHFDSECDDGSGPRRVRFSGTHGDLLCLGGAWRPTDSLGPDSFTIMLCEAGPDVSPFGAYQPVVIAPEFCSTFMHQTKDVRQLQQAGPRGILHGEVLERLSVSDATIQNPFDMAKPDPRSYTIDTRTAPSLVMVPPRSFH